jgi:hypothetical protein
MATKSQLIDHTHAAAVTTSQANQDYDLSGQATVHSCDNSVQVHAHKTYSKKKKVKEHP